MNERDLIATQTIKQISEGGDQVRADLKASAAAQDQLAASSQNLAVVTETSAKRQTSAAAAFDAMSKRMDPASRALAQLQKDQQTYDRALSQNSATLDRAGQGLSVYKDRLDAAAAAAENLRRQQANSSVNQGQGFSPGIVNKNTYANEFTALLEIADAKALQIGKQFGETLDSSMIAGASKSARDSASVFAAELDRLDDIANQKAMQAGKNFQDSLNQSMGIGTTGKSARDSAAVFEEAAKAQDAMAASAARLRAAINPLEAEQGKLGVETAHYRDLLKQQIITQDEFNAHQVMTSKRLGDFAQNLKTAGSAGRVMSGEMTNLGFQLNDVVTGLALGQSPFMIIAQQGGQVVQILQNSKASIGEFAVSAISSFGKLFTATRVLVGGVAGLGGGILIAAADWQSAQKDIERSLVGIGARTGTTVADVNKFASANASATGLSVDQARSSAIEFTKTGMIAVGQLKGLGDAVHGYSILTGKDATDATKDLAQALSGDLVKGAQDLNKTYGFLNPAMEDNIRKLVNQGERTKALQVIINAMASDNKKAEETVGSLARAWDYVWNAASRAKNAVGQAMTESPDEELQRLNRLQDRRALPGRGRRIDELNTQKTSSADDAFRKESARIQTAGRSAVEGVLPGIQQVQQLEKALGELQRAKEAANAVGITLVDNGAEQIIKNVITATQQATAETIRYNERVAAISQQWGNVGQSTALALQAMQNSLPVAQAWTEATRMRAQEQATYNNLIDKGKTSEEAAALAAKEYELSKAAAVASAEKLVQSSEDNLDKIRAQGTGMEAVVASSIAYRDAIQAGATATQAAAISANTLAAGLLQAQQAADRMTQSEIDKANGTTNGVVTENSFGGSAFTPTVMPSGTLSFSADPNLGVAYRNGGGGQRLDFGQTLSAVQQLIAKQNDPTNIANSYVAKGDYAGAIKAIEKQGGGTVDDRISLVDSLTQVMNSRTSDKGTQAANLQSELAWLNSLPETISRDQKIISLQQSIDQLKNSTDGLNGTMGDLLSPYYTQDPRTSHIGFRSQGMASGGEFTVPGGYSANDNMLAQIPVASGEIVSVRRPGQNLGGTTQTVQITNHITIAGNASKDDVGRTGFQLSQTMARQLRAGAQ